MQAALSETTYNGEEEYFMFYVLADCYEVGTDYTVAIMEWWDDYFPWLDGYKPKRGDYCNEYNECIIDGGEVIQELPPLCTESDESYDCTEDK